MMKSQRGLGLVEMLLAVTISVVIGSLMVGIFVQNNSVFNHQQSKVSGNIDLNNITQIINSDIRLAVSVANGYPVASPTYTSGDTVLVLKVSSVDASNNIINNLYDYIVIAPDSQNPYILREMVFPDAGSTRSPSNKVLTTGLVSVRFLYFNANNALTTPDQSTSVNFTVNVKGGVGRDTVTASASGLINLRNN